MGVVYLFNFFGLNCSMGFVRASTHGAIGHQMISQSGPLGLFLIPASAAQLVYYPVVCAILPLGGCI